MKLHPMNLAVALRRGALQSIEDGRGTQVHCHEGALWLTQQGDARDVVLEAGDEAVIERDGTSIVFALRDARFVLLDQGDTAGVVVRLRAEPSRPAADRFIRIEDWRTR